ncbi:MAG: sigma-70 family RNA polymerase sigma factor [Nannocystaceae bacterium]|nr:sigma-70 family RNA polymerase sigma factor [Nannocystaceae bacterium]
MLATLEDDASTGPDAAARPELAQADLALALSELIAKHQGPLRRYAQSVCPNDADADDAAQSTFEKLVAAPDQVRNPERTRQWLFTVVRHYCLRLLKRAWRWRAAVQPDELAATSALQLDDAELVRRMLHAIGELEPGQRDVLIRRDILGESGEVVAQALGLSLAATKSRLHRARKAVAGVGNG